MKIKKQELIEMQAYEDGLAHFVKQASYAAGDINAYSDLLRLSGRTLPRKRIVRFACDCALINIELIKPNADRYGLIVEFLKYPTTSTAAWASAWAASFAGDNNARTAARAAALAAKSGSKEKVDKLLIDMLNEKE